MTPVRVAAKRRTWRLAGAVAIGMLVVSVIVVMQSISGEPQEGPRYEAPSLIPAPVLTFLFLSIPAGLVAVAVLRRSPTMLVVAGAIALLQSLISFSGATFGFLLPGLLLLYLGAREGDASDSPRPPVRERVAGLAIIALVVAAWVVTFSSAQTVCWVAHVERDGHVVYRIVEDTGSIDLGPSDVAGGCDSRTPTLTGLISATALIAAAFAVSARSGLPRQP